MYTDKLLLRAWGKVTADDSCPHCCWRQRSRRRTRWLPGCSGCLPSCQTWRSTGVCVLQCPATSGHRHSNKEYILCVVNNKMASEHSSLLYDHYDLVHHRFISVFEVNCRFTTLFEQKCVSLIRGLFSIENVYNQFPHNSSFTTLITSSQTTSDQTVMHLQFRWILSFG